MITFKQRGDFSNAERFFKKASSINLAKLLDGYGQEGVEALSAATPVDTGLTASSWNYETQSSPTFAKIYWTNSNVENGTPIAILIQYGHATANGAYIQGRDFINPAIRPIFDRLAEDIWREVRSY